MLPEINSPPWDLVVFAHDVLEYPNAFDHVWVQAPLQWGKEHLCQCEPDVTEPYAAVHICEIGSDDESEFFLAGQCPICGRFYWCEATLEEIMRDPND